MRSKLFKFFAVIMLFALITPSVFVQAQADGPNLPEVNRPELEELEALEIPSETGRYVLVLEGNSLLEETGTVKEGISIQGQSYLQTLAVKREQTLDRLEIKLGRSLSVLEVFDVLVHGVSVELSPLEAAKIEAMPEVRKVFPVTLEQPVTDAGPEWIGANALWDGTAVPATVGSQGEGVLVGIIDTGINFDHPSFSDQPADLFDYEWEGDYLGVCATDGNPLYADACNDKLVGAYSYTQKYEALTPEDAEGHGSHTASTVAGNLVEMDYFGFTQLITGVAPHAQIVSYDVCIPSGCYSDWTAAAIEQAVIDGVDVINYSISGGEDPLNDLVEYMFLYATQAGLTVSTSAGNSGPAAGTVAHRSPWVLSTAATTHDRKFVNSVVNFSEQFTNIDTYLGSIPFTEAVVDSAIVYAGEDDGNELGCVPFPADFFADSIALIKRGTCTFDVKVDNAEAAGATGVLIFTTTADPGGLAGVTATIPNVMLAVNGTTGQAIADWVAVETDETVSISAFYKEIDGSNADIMADFSSRGPNSTFDVLKPDLGAPGVEILAAYLDGTIAPDSEGDYTLMSGTSMSSPHAAGSAALLKALHPDWSPSEIQSALMLTAFEEVKVITDGVAVADPFDIGAGRIQLEKAGLVGLVMDESIAHYYNAVYGSGVDVKDLNIPSLQNSECVNECSWTRTFTSVADWPAHYEVEAPEWITVEPADFNINPGETLEITVTANVEGSPLNVWKPASILFNADGTFESGDPISDVHIPLAVLPSASDIPGMVTFDTHRDADGAVVEDLTAVEITEGTVFVSGLVKADLEEFVLASDPTNDDPIDDLEDVFVKRIDYSAGDRFVAEITETESPDVDMFLYYDADGDDEFVDDDFLVAASAAGGSMEYISTPRYNRNLTFFLVVQNWQPERAGDSVTLATASVTFGVDQGNMEVVIPTAQDAGEPFDMEITWDEDTEEGDRLYGYVDVYAYSETSTYLGGMAIDIRRFEDDVIKSVDVVSALAGDTVTYTIDVTNFKDEPITYTIDDELPELVEYVVGSVTNAEYDALANAIVFEDEIAAGGTVAITFQATVDDVDPEKIITNSALHDGDGLGMLLEQTLPVSFIAEDELPVAEGQDLTTNEDVPLDITLTGTGLLPGPETWTILTEPMYGELTGVAPDLTYEPDLDWYGTDSFTFMVNDGLNDSNVGTIDIEVISVKDAPQANPDDYWTDFETQLVVSAEDGVMANDGDPDPEDDLYVDLETDVAYGTLNLLPDGSFTYTPDDGFRGTDQFVYTLYGIPAPTDTTMMDATVTITVNDIPVADAQSVETDEDTPLVVTLTGDFLEPGPVSWILIDEDEEIAGYQTVEGGLVVASPGTDEVTYTPPADWFGTDSFDFKVNDGLNESEAATITIDVLPINDAPVAMADAYETDEDITLTVAAPGVLANDEDVEDDPLSVVLGTSVVEHGMLTLNADGSFTYEPDADWYGTDTFSYIVSDGSTDPALSAEDIVTITVAPVNDAPVAGDDAYEMDEDTTITYYVSNTESLIVNDYDVDGDLLDYTLVDDVEHGALTLWEPGGFKYTPDEDFNGTDTFTYIANDGELDSNIATVTITINPVNDAPVAADDDYHTPEETELVVSAAEGILANDSDIDGDALTFELGDLPDNGVLDMNADGSFSYEPLLGFIGTDTFTYTLSDGSTDPALTDTATVTIIVNDIPVALDAEYETVEDTPLDITLTQDPAFSDPGLATWTVIDADVVTPGTQTAQGGTITDTTLPSLTYTPAANFVGTDSFEFTVNDGLNESEPGTITIEVTPVNDSPQAMDDFYAVDADDTLVVPAPGVLENDVEYDDDTVYVQLASEPEKGTLTFNSNGSFIYEPDATDPHGVVSFTYTMFGVPQPADAYSDTATVTITIDDWPIAVDDEYETGQSPDTLTVVELDGLLANDIDPDPENEDGLTVNTTPVEGPFNGSVILNSDSDGSFTYTPDADFRGYDSFVYEVEEPNSSLTDEGTVTILVNDGPMAYDASLETPEETPIEIDLTDHADWIPYMPEEDSEDPTTWTIVAQPEHGTLAGTAPELTYTPDLNYVGDDEFTFIVNDGLSDSNEGTITITMTPVNDPSEAEDDAYETPEDTELVVAAEDGVMANDSDPDDDPLVVSLVTDVAYGTLDLNADGSFTYMPDADFNGEDSFVYELYSLADGTTDPFYSDQATVIITVTPVNDAPVAVDDTYETAEDVELVVAAPGVLTNDTDVDAEDTHTAVLATDVLHGSLTLNADGSFSYMPDVDFYGEDSFTYMANDGTADSNVATVTITVTPVNDAPVAQDQSVTTPEETALPITLVATDVDGDALTYAIVDQPAHGSVILVGNVATYTPALDFNGTDSFTFMANDGELDSEMAVVTITVTPVNDDPVAIDDAYETDEDTTLTVAAPGVLENDGDVDEDNLASYVLTQPAHGTLTLASDGSFTYVPEPEWNGTDTFTYQLVATPMLNAAWTDEATVTITVNSVNDAPVAVEDAYTTNEDEVLTVDVATGVLANDTDVDGDALTAMLVSDVSNGTLALAADGSFVYTPDENFFGSDSFTYKASDGTLESDTVTVTLTVTTVNDWVEANDDAYETIAGVTLDVAAPGVLDNDVLLDPDETVTLDVIVQPADGTLTLNDDGSFTYVPDAGFFGVDTFEYQLNSTVMLQGEFSDTAVVTITVKPYMSLFLPIIWR